jgi:hypothetical protein
MPLEYSTTQLSECTDFEAPKPKYLESHLKSFRSCFQGCELHDFVAFVEKFSQGFAKVVNGTKESIYDQNADAIAEPSSGSQTIPDNALHRSNLLPK